MSYAKESVRLLANSLPIFRGLSGFWIAKRLREVPPQDRTWTFAVAVLGIEVTDKIDGILARQIGPSDFGGWLDQMGDKAFVLPILHALGKNGEIPMWYFHAKLGRDVGVTILRSLASKNNQNVDALPLGKFKTSFEMIGIAIATSPLAKSHRDLMNGAFFLAAGLNVVSGAEYAIKFSAATKNTPLEGLEELIKE